VIALLYLLGGAAQLVGVGLVIIDVLQARRAAQEWLDEANEITRAQSDFRFRVGPPDVKADWALQLMEALKAKLAANLDRGRRRALWGAVLVIVGIVMTTVASVAAL
jgi:hypothetical protein